MPSDSPSYTSALAALALSARSIAAAPPQERGWRLRRMIAEAARLAAADGEEPLTLAHDAWQAALGATARAAAGHAVAAAAPAGAGASISSISSIPSPAPADARGAVRAARTAACDAASMNVLPFRRPARR
jgi:hypothetical protein